VTILLAWLAIWLSDFIGTAILGFVKTPISPVMLAILLGMLVSATLRLPDVLKPGLTFAIKKLLRLGIILLGIRLTIFDVLRLGACGIPVVVVCIVCALLITTRTNDWLKLPRRLGTLIAVGTSICGVSAIIATAPVIEAEDEEVAYSIAVITIFGLLATLFYPYLAHLIFGGNTTRVGLFLGTSVHDTSQVIGSAKVYADVYTSPAVLDGATVTKLVRNVFMAVVIPLMSFYYLRGSEHTSGTVGRKAHPLNLVPLFVLGFLALAVLRSIGDAGANGGGYAFGILGAATWQGIHNTVKTWAERLIVVALSGVGLSTRLRAFKGLGLQPFLVGLVAALAVGAVSFVAISLLGSWAAL
jgi:uncharacterized integral membrane protein (TIGR00698 family)